MVDEVEQLLPLMMEMIVAPLLVAPKRPKNPGLGAGGRTGVAVERCPAIHVTFLAPALNPKRIQEVLGLIADRGSAIDVTKERPQK